MPKSIDDDFDIELITKKEIMLLCRTPPKECSICEQIINYCIFQTKDGFWVSTENLDDSDIIHLEQIFKRKLFK